jgi:hypothetical protein
METQNETEKSPKFECKICDYKCFKNCDMNKHLLTKKHINGEKGYKMDTKDTTPKLHICECGKEYSHHAGLWKHKKKCNEKSPKSPFGDKNSVDTVNKNYINEITPDLIIQIIKQNQELQKQNHDLQTQVLELCKNGTHNSNNSNNTNSHNKTFNLQFFLNETCKDAMNIMDFVDSIKIQLTDLEKVGKIGYVEGISNIIVKNLNSLDETKRPVHCTDSKREVMYVKDEDKWEKENEEKKKLRKAIKHIAHKNSKLLRDFKTKHPDCEKSESKFSDQYNKLIIEAMGGKGDNDLEKEDKIIKNIAKEVTIDKETN